MCVMCPVTIARSSSESSLPSRLSFCRWEGSPILSKYSLSCRGFSSVSLSTISGTLTLGLAETLTLLAVLAVPRLRWLGMFCKAPVQEDAGSQREGWRCPSGKL